ncbi:antitoxin [uncultured Amnibacterium sp.]|uniref:antitoxin n=1 Tax=uncultured Amnibacterium sp. TaxID=1631851 RepID=UPI0035CBEDC0
MAGLFDKAKDLLGSEQAEGISDQALDKAADFASKKTGGSHDDAIKGIRDAADQRLGNE